MNDAIGSSSATEPHSWAVPARPPDLGIGEVHVWLAHLSTLRGPMAASADGLSRDELARAASFRFPYLNRRFVGARMLLRGLTGMYVGAEPRTVRFSYGPHGKPELAFPTRRLRFNVSHSGEWVIEAFAWGREVGVDIEVLRPIEDVDALAERYFSVEEARDVHLVAQENKLDLFYRYWTRKEACVKAWGGGLSLPLDRFRVSLDASRPVQIVTTTGRVVADTDWFVAELGCSAGAVAALAVRGHPRVRRWRWAFGYWGLRSGVHAPVVKARTSGKDADTATRKAVPGLSVAGRPDCE
jgi:4'-phosphopantetheinyl transferase